MFEVISLDDRVKWNKIIRSMKTYDFYFLAEYHQLDQSGLPLLLHYQNGQDSLVIPVIVRNIENTDYKDITSVYGYAGPLSNRENPCVESISGFQRELNHFFDSYRIVSAFSRFHSLFPFQSKLLEGIGVVFGSNHTIGIDLTLAPNDQRRQYVHSLKNVINKLKRKNIIVKKASSKEEIDLFIEIYEETMNRVKASPIYFFPKNYFYRFLDSIDSFILLAFYKETPIGGSLCSICNGIMETHLSAARSDFLYLSPLKLVWDELRLLGTRKGLRILHLGGGVRDDNDSLFLFKSQFSKQLYPFKIWKYIYNQSVYDSLVLQRFGKDIPATSFFPLYRF
jgi:hypothetical protein